MFKRKQSQERKQQPAGLEIPLRLGPAVRASRTSFRQNMDFHLCACFSENFFFTEKTEQSQKNKKDVDLQPLYLNLEPNTPAEAGVCLSQSCKFPRLEQSGYLGEKKSNGSNSVFFADEIPQNYKFRCLALDSVSR